jgi:hypothetical protein
MTPRHIARACAPLLLCACTLLHERAQDTPRSRPAGDEGMLLYTIGRLTFEAPAGWQASGDARRVLLRSAAGDAQLEAQVADRTFADDAACLAEAEDRLVRRASSAPSGPSKMTNVRRHPTTVAGRKAVVQEADQAGWHGWAWALCDRGEQYLLYFTGHSPLNPDAVRASRLLPSSATLAAGPSA